MLRQNAMRRSLVEAVGVRSRNNVTRKSTLHASNRRRLPHRTIHYVIKLIKWRQLSTRRCTRLNSEIGNHLFLRLGIQFKFLQFRKIGTKTEVLICHFCQSNQVSERCSDSSTSAKIIRYLLFWTECKGWIFPKFNMYTPPRKGKIRKKFTEYVYELKMK